MVDRYDFNSEGWGVIEIEECNDGDYVKYEDYKNLEEMLDIAWVALEEAGYTGFSERLKDFMENRND